MTTSSSSSQWADKKIFTTGEAAEVCKVSQQTIIRCFDSGRLQGFRVPGSKFRRIPRDELIRFMQSNGIPTDILDAGRRRVLVVDDDEKILEVFRDLLQRDGRFEFETASTGYDAGLLTEQFRPHLIILDYMLPDVNGNVVCKRLKEHRETKDIKIVFVSGVINEHEIKSLLGAGGDAFLKKPFNLEALLGKMTELLEMSADAPEGK